MTHWSIPGFLYIAGRHHWGGNWQGLIDYIPALADMGVGAIQMLPFWKHIPPYIYSIIDYYDMDGQEADIIHIINQANAYGIQVFFDLVTGYVCEDSVIFQDHQEWILKNDDGTLAETWPHNFGYVLDRRNPEVIQYFVDVAEYYIDNYGIRGWRLDATANQWNPYDFPDQNFNILPMLNSLRMMTDSKAGNRFLISEHYGTRQDWGFKSNQDNDIDQFVHVSYSYLHRRHLLGSAIESDQSGKTLEQFLEREHLYAAIRSRFIETHDTKRALAVLDECSTPRAAIFPMLTEMCFTPSVPVLLAGQEIGETVGRSAEDPFPAVNWDSVEVDIWEYMFYLGDLLRSPVFQTPEITSIRISGTGCLGMERSTATKSYIAFLNYSDQEKTVSIWASKWGAYNAQSIFEDPPGYAVVVPESGIISMKLQPYEVVILKSSIISDSLPYMPPKPGLDIILVLSLIILYFFLRNGK